MDGERIFYLTCVFGGGLFAALSWPDYLTASVGLVTAVGAGIALLVRL